ncbi:Uncharacterised protein [Segatella copri]|nr:Uncharacterised protein [Segatella copri]
MSLSLMPRRTMVRFTVVPLGPRRRFMISSLLILTPEMAVSFTATMRSPAMIPTFSEGPFVTGWITSSVSSTMLNCTPMPSKLPFSGSFIALVSLAVA